MSDIEIVRACADAMGLTVREVTNNEPQHTIRLIRTGEPYFPLTDDAQAMALVKRFRMWIDPPEAGVGWGAQGVGFRGEYTRAPTLNKAICECVANMQKALP